MGYLLLSARLLLAGVFLVAALGKLADRGGSRQALISFGLPPRLAYPLGIVLPLVELVVAAALMFGATTLWGALGAIMLLLVFIAGIAITLARGRTPDCHCFGRLHSAPAGWPTLARNAALAAIAAFVAWQSANPTDPRITGGLAAVSTPQLIGLSITTIVLGMLLFQGWLLMQLLRQNGRLLLRIEALEARLAAGSPAVVPPRAVLPLTERRASDTWHDHRGSCSHENDGADKAAASARIGEAAPGFTLPDLGGKQLSLHDFHGNRTILLFWNPHCGYCRQMRDELRVWEAAHPKGDPTLVIISSGPVEEQILKGISAPILLDHDFEVGSVFGAVGTPSAVLIDAAGTIASGLAVGKQAILELLMVSAELEDTSPQVDQRGG